MKGAQELGFGAEEKKEPETEAENVEEHSEEKEQTAQDETDTFLARFKAEAAKRLKEVQKAEDAADEALLRFGTNIRNFLKDAVSVSAPDEESTTPGEVLFESKDGSSGKRVIHTSRFDAQLHVIHTTLSSFTEDASGSGGQWDDFAKDFDIDKMTDRIAQDLDKYSELRNAMEKLVPEKVEYKDFWMRYYFLRHVVETQEEKRKELLKGRPHVDSSYVLLTNLPATANQSEEVAWDEDSDDEHEKTSTPQLSGETVPKVLVVQNTNDSSTTLHQTPPQQDPSALQPSRRSHDEKSVADSDASYDLVSGATSRAQGSPKESPTKIEESDEEDWE